VTVALFSTSSVGEMLDVLVERLPDLEVRTCFIALYDAAPALPKRAHPFAPTLRQQVRVSSSPTRISRAALAPPVVFASTYLLPPELLLQGASARSFVVAPLFFPARDPRLRG